MQIQHIDIILICVYLNVTYKLNESYMLRRHTAIHLCNSVLSGQLCKKAYISFVGRFVNAGSLRKIKCV